MNLRGTRISDSDWGWIKVLSRAGHTPAELHGLCGLSLPAIRMQIRATQPPSKRRRSVPPALTTAHCAARKHRQALVKACARQTKRAPVRGAPASAPQFKKVLKHCSPAAIKRELALAKNTVISASTIRRDLIDMNFKCYSVPKAPRVSIAKRKRIEFCKKTLKLLDEGVVVCFSDEKWFDSNDNGRPTAWARSKAAVGTRDRVQHPPKLHVWGCISSDGMKQLVVFKDPNAPVRPRRGKARPKRNLQQERFSVNAQVCCDQCLGPNAHELKKGRRALMQDGAKPHTAKLKREFLRRQNITILDDWPPRSPDLNPIETVWSVLAERVSNGAPRNADALEKFVRREWAAFDPQRLCDIFRKRLELDGGLVKL